MVTELDAGADVYEIYAREEAADRGRLRVSICLALVLHAVVLAVPWPRSSGDRRMTLPATAVTPFRLHDFRFRPPQSPPTAATTVTDERAPEDTAPPAEPQAPPLPSAELLVPPGPAGSLVPPQPVATPPPPYPETLWERGVGGEVVLTLVIDPFGVVTDVEREEGAQELADAAAQTVRRWTFLPATLDGQPVATAVSVRVSFPLPAAPAVPAGRD